MSDLPAAIKRDVVDTMNTTMRKIRTYEADYQKYLKNGNQDLAEDTMSRLVVMYHRKEGQLQIVEALGIDRYVAKALEAA